MSNLRVWMIPQIPGHKFIKDVRTFREARLLLESFAAYDKFQLAANIKGDYASVGGLLVFDEFDTTDNPRGSWIEWEDDNGRNIWDVSGSDIDALDAMDGLRESLAVMSESELAAAFYDEGHKLAGAGRYADNDTMRREVYVRGIRMAEIYQEIDKRKKNAVDLLA